MNIQNIAEIIFKYKYLHYFDAPRAPSTGYLGKQNHPLSWNLVVWCAKIGSQTQNL